MSNDEERIRRLEQELASQRQRSEDSRGCLFGVLGAIVGALLCGRVPFAYVTQSGGGREQVEALALGGPVIYKTEGPLGTKNSVKTVCMLAKVVLGGGCGAAIGYSLGKGSKST